ncbi:hypothetical protein BU24DRAFT_447912 [Aaosphaeria arxii CBS 175.79]|uniref:NADH-ubiquinone oxidoreductase 299 kDa subunit n=1 Tax=Aaosphaeria arxii CBS 175.79 TaxID=1450172 RepID=A0A6A5Y2F0_9PLEO|nr:uncharacterized protein BU24DRAFT_447912 [Aaosphaeria arxii CBS 175.79]KAF2019406.1 hypothetical protein BU24DRAFT_447912 [Aaosphaeria arxii CBS 175.79]
MRAAARLLANVKQSKFLEPGTPTGLTGLITHPTPRSTLLYHYSSTLDKLKQIPESSVYRQSTEALTKHRLKIVESAKPAGWDAWKQTVDMQVADHPEAFDITTTTLGTSIALPKKRKVDERRAAAEWDGEIGKSFPEGSRTEKERRKHHATLGGPEGYSPDAAFKEVKLEAEPQLTAEQISDIESQIGAGLIEEVIQVAEGEHKLVDEMVNSKIWEELTEKAPEGQWSYFERGAHKP